MLRGKASTQFSLWVVVDGKRSAEASGEGVAELQASTEGFLRDEPPCCSCSTETTGPTEGRLAAQPVIEREPGDENMRHRSVRGRDVVDQQEAILPWSGLDDAAAQIANSNQPKT